VHYTTQEYFERIGSRLSPDGQLSIAEACLTYLSFNVFKSGRCATDQELERRLYQHELLEYAARYCGEHIRSVEAKVAHLACRFLTHSGTLSCAAQVLFVPSYKFKEYSATSLAITGLHWIALFGLCDIAEQFLHTIEVDTVRTVNTRDSWGRCPLAYAAEYGHYELARLLLDKGADVDAQGGYLGNALQVASYEGHEVVVRLLLEKGANVNAQGGLYGGALRAASSIGHEAVVRLLLEKGADAQYYGNVLGAASYGGREAVVRVLLEKGVNAQYYGNALEAASSEGYEAVVRLLLEKGADAQYYGNALEAASYGGHEAVVMLLLEKGATAQYYGNALRAASYRGHKAVVRLLLKKEANVYKQDRHYSNML
jgi:ankyrin repeat protein